VTDVAGIRVDALEPDFAVSDDTVTLVVIGSGLQAAVDAQLSLPGESVIPAQPGSVAILADTALEAAFTLTDAVDDRWDLGVNDGLGESYVFYGALDVLAFPGDSLPFCEWSEFSVHDGTSITIGGFRIGRSESVFMVLKKGGRLGYNSGWDGRVSVTSHSGDTVATVHSRNDVAFLLEDLPPDLYELSISAYDPGGGEVMFCSTLPVATIGDWYIGEIMRPGGYDWVQVDVPAGESALYFQTEGFGLASTLYVCYEDLTDPIQSWTFGSGYHIEGDIQNPPAGRYYIRYMDSAVLEGGPDGQRRQYMLYVDAEPPPDTSFAPVVTGLSTYVGGQGPVTVTVSGRGLDSASTVKLVREGYADIAANSVYGDSNRVELLASFDLSGAELGDWELVVTNPGGQSDTSGASFQVVSSNDPALEVEIIGRTQIRVGRPQSYAVRIRNGGNVDALCPSLAMWIPTSVVASVVLSDTVSLLYDPDDLPEYYDETIHGFYLDLAIVPAHSSQEIDVVLTSSYSTGPEFPIVVVLLDEYSYDTDLGRGSELSMFGQPQGLRAEAIGLRTYRKPGALHFVWTFPDRDVAFHSGSNGSAYEVQQGSIQAIHEGLEREGYALQMAKTMVGLDQQGINDYYNAMNGVVCRQPPDPCPQFTYDNQRWKDIDNLFITCSGLGEWASEKANWSNGEGFTPADFDRNAHAGAYWLVHLFGGTIKDLPQIQTSRIPAAPLIRIKQWRDQLPNPVGSSLGVVVVTSTTPEDKYGPSGYDPDETAPDLIARFVSEDRASYSYRIDYWNHEDATAPAQAVYVVDTIDLDFELTSLRFTEFGFCNQTIPLEGGQYFNLDVTMRPVQGLEDSLRVNVEGTLDPDHRVVSWTMLSYDPITGEPPDIDDGFLYPIDSTGYQIGWVDFEIDPLPGLATGTRIENQALVNFDSLPACDTCPFWSPAPKERPWVNTIDAEAPESYVIENLDTVDVTYFTVSWTADDGLGSGVKAYSVYVSDNGGSYEPWLVDTLLDSAVYSGENEHTYRFYTIAEDNVGHIENPPDSFDAQVTIYYEYICGDINGDGAAVPDISDLVHLVAYMFQGGDPPAVMEAADVNCDGSSVPDIADLVYLVAYMFSGGPDPCDPCSNPVAAKRAVSKDKGEIVLNAQALDSLSSKLSLVGIFTADVAGLQQRYTYDPTATEIDSIVAGHKHRKLGVYYHADDGELDFGMVDLEGQSYISSGQSEIATIYYHSIAQDSVRAGLHHEMTLAADRGALKMPIAVKTGDNVVPVPRTFALHQNYPNPFNAATVIKYDLPRASDVRIDVYNVLGQRVVTLVDGQQNAGFHEIVWNSTNEDGGTVASGVYFYRIQAEDFTQSKKMVLLK